jgi:predicted phage terminase large subunit-like protein
MGASAAAFDTIAPDRALLEAASLLVPKWTKYIPHMPEPPQQAFLLLPHKEAFYGGAAGGGKSDALLMGALQYVDVPGYNALILRRTFDELALPEAIMARSLEWLMGTDARWSAQEHRWTFPSSATLTFGHVQYEKDRFKYQGSAFQYIAFDELTEFEEIVYRFLFSRLRRLEGFKVPLRMRGASNPGGLGHDWVKRRFIDEGHDHERPFIPAKVQDNPHLDIDEYIASLMNLDPLTRKRLLDGDWSVRPMGAMFRQEWFKIVDQLPSPIVRTVRVWDFAATEEEGGNDPDYTAGVKMALLANRQLAILDVERMRQLAGKVEQAVERAAIRDGRPVKIIIKQEPGSSGKTVVHYYTKKLLGYTVKGVPDTGKKEDRAGPLASQAQIGNVLLLRGSWNGEFLDEAAQFPTKGVHDDQIDSASTGLSELVINGGGRLYTA